MDHLMTHREYMKFGETIDEIEWLGFDHDETREYPVLPIEDYLEQRGIPTKAMDGLLKSEMPCPDLSILAIIQSWLFFGALESVFNQRFHTKPFIYEGTTGPSLTTRILRQMLHWENCFPHESQQSADERQFRLENTLSFLHQRVVLFAAHGYKVPRHTPIYHRVLRLLMICGETLYQLRRFLSPDKFLAFPPFVFQSTEEHRLILYKKMAENGWCRSFWRQMMDDFSVCTAEYVSVINATDGEPLDHSQCSDDFCVAKNSNLDNYTARHIRPGCNCDTLKPSLESIKNAYQTQKIPLVHVDRLLENECSGEEVMEYVSNEETPYIAISHVWSDGLCSDADSGLPRCQIERLARLMTSCPATEYWKPRLIFIDTMCIPRDGETKGRAINAMASIYAKSCAVIVLDSTVETIESASSSIAFLLVRLIASPWFHRLWTLQEAMLAPLLFFNFRDQMLEAWALLRRSRSELWRQHGVGNLKKGTLDDVYSPLEQEIGLVLSNILDIRATESSNAGIELVTDLLKHRTSSFPTDEILGIASLLDLNIEPLTALESFQRTCNFWTQVSRVPANVIFQKQDKIPIHGFGWAPVTFMTPQARPALKTEYGVATVTQHGLRGFYHLLVLKVTQDVTIEPKQRGFLLEMSKRECYGFAGNEFVSLTLQAGQSNVLAVDGLPPLRSDSRPSRFRGYSLNESALLTELPLNPDLDLPQYKYVRQCAVTFGHEPWTQPVPWEKYENDPEYADELANDITLLFRWHTLEHEEIYIV